MRDIICSGCSFTNFEFINEDKVLRGITPEIDGVNPLGSYPEAIHRNFGHKVYNAGMAGNNISSSVLSIISIADRLLKEGRKISIILQCTEFTRQSYYMPVSFQIMKNVAGDTNSVRNNTYLFDGSESGWFQFGTLGSAREGFSENPNLTEIARSLSDIFTIESAYIDSLVHILLLQNYCKVNDIPYKIFCKTESFSLPFSPVFKIDFSNTQREFESIFIEKQFPFKKRLSFVNSDPYIKNLFGMLDLDKFWFLDDENCKFGGITEWVYAKNIYRKGHTEYTPLVVEDIDGTPTEFQPMYPIQRAIDKIENKTFNPNGHPTYFYWDMFVNREIIKWEIL
jgi:hypothetical protein